MVKIKDYQNGKAGKAVKRSVDMLRSIKGSLPAISEFGLQLENHMSRSEPALIDLTRAEKLIDQAEACAVGDRICYCEFDNVPHTISVFLDELAQALDEVGKARLTTKARAKELIGQNAKHPIAISKVDGKYMEICRTHPRSCLYWNAEKAGVKCFVRHKDRTLERKDDK